MNLHVQVNPINSEIYSEAQKIIVLPSVLDEQQCASTRVTSNIVSRNYEFSSEMLENVRKFLGLDEPMLADTNLNHQSVVWRWGGQGPAGKNGARNNLIKTAAEMFVLLRISKK
jgi:hypothetical protein